MKRMRLKKWTKWACTVAAAFVLAVAIFSGFRCTFLESVSKDGKSEVCLVVGTGLAVYGNISPSPQPWAAGQSKAHFAVTRTWCWGLHDETKRKGISDEFYGGLMYRHDASEQVFGFTLLYPFLLFSLPAAVLWYRDKRKPGPHQCEACRYDRGGLAQDAICPECGAVPTSATN